MTNWNYKNPDDITKRALDAFCAEVKRVYFLEGMDYVLSQCPEIDRDIVKDISANKYKNHFCGVPQEDKDFINKFQKLFNRNKDNNNHIWHNLLIQIAPDSLRKLSKELENYVEDTTLPDGSKMTWQKLSKDLNITRNALYNYTKGIVYPNSETLGKLSTVINPTTIAKVADDLYGIKSNTNVQEVKNLFPYIPEWSDDDKDMLILEILKEVDPERKLKIAAYILSVYS